MTAAWRYVPVVKFPQGGDWTKRHLWDYGGRRQIHFDWVTNDIKMEEIKEETTGENLKQQDDQSSTEEQAMSHQDAMSTVKTMLSSLIQNDPLLCDLHDEITLEEIQSQIALEYGQAMTVFIHRNDGDILPIVVIQNGTLLDLKKAIKRHVALKQARAGGIKHISWRSIWKSYWLIFEGQKLDIDGKLLKDYGIRNRADLKFIKRLRQR